MAYRVPRRFIQPPEEPPPYGLVLLSFLGHTFFFLMAAAISTYVGKAPESQIYIVNLVPALSPPAGSPVPRTTPRPTPPKVAEAPAPPKPEAEPAPPKAAEAPAPPKPEVEPAPPKRPPIREVPQVEPPPLEIPKVAKAEPAKPVPKSELTLPRRVVKETPALRTPTTPERTPPPPRPSPPAPQVRMPEPPRVVAPRVAPAPPMTAARPGVEPVRLGRPDAPPSAANTISLDVSDFPYTYYLRLVKDKISEKWTNPRLAAVGGERAIVLFEIGRDGQLMREPQVEHSSGNAVYDQAAVRAVAEARPFPPLPAEFKAPSLRVHFGFEYRPDEG